MEGIHQAVRPSWRCGNTTCGEDWPCEPARQTLIADFGNSRVSLAVAMAIEMGHAAGDLPDATAGHLYARFIAWTRPAGVTL